jgi:hypothetical protein
MQPTVTLQPEQREVLAQALADAVSYRDPPVYCAACETKDGGLCEECTATLARARAYLALSRTLGMAEAPQPAARGATGEIPSARPE